MAETGGRDRSFYDHGIKESRPGMEIMVVSVGIMRSIIVIHIFAFTPALVSTPVLATLIGMFRGGRGRIDVCFCVGWRWG